MISKSMYLASVVIVGLSCVPLLGQEKSTRDPQALMKGPVIQLPAVAIYTSISDGLVISSVRSEMHRPLTSPETEATFQFEYARVNGFEVPSHLIPEIGSSGVIEYRLNNCQVSLTEWPKKRQSR
jgi:hypothetical protein